MVLEYAIKDAIANVICPATKLWNTVVGVYAPLVYRWCRHRCLKDIDITQEVLSQVVSSKGCAPAAGGGQGEQAISAGNCFRRQERP